MVRWLVPMCLLSLAGCMPGPSQTELVPANPFAGTTASPVQTVNAMATPATQAASLRVLQVGQKVMAANPQIGLKPCFSTVGPSTGGAPAEEIFHAGSSQVVITETLVGKCTTDGQLAAVLCVELAKMAAERDQGPAGYADDIGPPPDVPISGDGRGTFGPADGTRAVELAKYDRSHHRGLHVVEDPKIQARTFLTRAGFGASDLEAAAPLLRSAEQNVKLEKQMTAPAPGH